MKREQHPSSMQSISTLAPDAASALNRTAYDRIAHDWDDARSRLHEREQNYLDALLTGFSTDAHVLDLGCGTGRPIAAYLLARGCRVTGVDQSPALLAMARRRLPHACWIEARLEDVRFDTTFDAVVCWDALFHIHRAHHGPLFDRMRKWLARDGRLLMTFGGSAQPAFTDVMFGETFFYDSHPPQQVLDMLGDLGFEPLVSEFMNPPTTGRDKGRYAVVMRYRG